MRYKKLLSTKKYEPVKKESKENKDKKYGRYRHDRVAHDSDDDVFFIELQHVGYKNLYPYGPAKTA
jgi:hypothetical protein